MWCGVCIFGCVHVSFLLLDGTLCSVGKIVPSESCVKNYCHCLHNCHFQSLKKNKIKQNRSDQSIWNIFCSNFSKYFFIFLLSFWKKIESHSANQRYNIKYNSSSNWENPQILARSSFSTLEFQPKKNRIILMGLYAYWAQFGPANIKIFSSSIRQNSF